MDPIVARLVSDCEWKYAAGGVPVASARASAFHDVARIAERRGRNNGDAVRLPNVGVSKPPREPAVTVQTRTARVALLIYVSFVATRRQIGC